jgi:hypothetical protein
MEENLENQKKIILDYFEENQNDIWKTIEEISNNTRIEPQGVLKIITSSGDFVRSSYRLKAGEPLFTSRKNFRGKAPFVDKMIGAFKNRID